MSSGGLTRLKNKDFLFGKLSKNGSNVFFRTKHKNVNISSTVHTVVEKIMYFIFFVKCPYLQNEKKVYKERKECNGGVEAE